MKFSTADFPKVQASVFAALLMVIIGGSVLYLSSKAREAAQQARIAVTAQRSVADGKLKQVREEESEIKQKSILFNKLQERGIIGEEQRLDWVELLKDIRDKRRLIDLRYDISPQRALDSGPASDFAFYGSAMKIELKLLHEEDLTRLLGDLQSQARALIRVNSCHVERLPPTAHERGEGWANLSADCEIEWLTVRDVSKK